MSLLVGTLKDYPDSGPLRRNTMGFVANIAEVPELRQALVARGLFEQLLHSLDGGHDLEVVYNVAGTFCHLLAEGEEFWVRSGLELDSRARLLQAIGALVAEWKWSTDHWINYRSLKPVIGLLRNGVEKEIHLWSAWALLGLCRVNPEKYCRMCCEEGGYDALAMVRDLKESDIVTLFCSDTIALCDGWRARAKHLQVQ